MLHIVLWKWNQPGFRIKYTARHINAVVRMLKKHMSMEYRVVCVTDDPTDIECETYPLWSDCSHLENPASPKMPSCFRRLRLFDPQTQEDMGIGPDDKIVSLDADVVIVADPRRLFERKESFVGLRVAGTYHRTVLNGSVWMFKARQHADVWSDFHPDHSPQLIRDSKFFGSDQGWLSMKMLGKCGLWVRRNGIVSYARDCRPRPTLPDLAIIVSFHGRRKPWMDWVQGESPWIRRHYPHTEHGV